MSGEMTSAVSFPADVRELNSIQRLLPLTHQSTESLKSPWNSDARVDFDEYPLGGLNVDLQQSGLVQRRVEERQQTLQTDQSVSDHDSLGGGPYDVPDA